MKMAQIFVLVAAASVSVASATLAVLVNMAVGSVISAFTKVV